MFEDAKAHLPNQIAAFLGVVASGAVVAGPHQRSVFLVLGVQPVLQVLVDADFGGDQRQLVQGGLGTVAARKTQFVGVGLVFGNAGPADDGGQGAALDDHVVRMTNETTKMIRLRSGKGAPLWVVSGTASAAASETAPRNPAQLDAVRWRQAIRRSRCDSRRSTVRTSTVVASPQAIRVTTTTRVTETAMTRAW